MSQGIVRNRSVVALETFMHYGRKGIPKPVTPHKKLPGVSSYRRVETASGDTVYLPANRPALKDFNQLSENEKAALITSAPPVRRTGEPECESKRILAGSRFKALPRGKREGDVFVGDRIRPIYPTSTGSLEKVHDIHRRASTFLRESKTEKTIRSLKYLYGVTEKQALWMMEEAEKLRIKNLLAKK